MFIKLLFAVFYFIAGLPALVVIIILASTHANTNNIYNNVLKDKNNKEQGGDDL